MSDECVLVIDDNQMNLTLMSGLLKLGKYRMLSAEDAETGLQLAQEHVPDAILMDIQLPGMDGIAATRCLQENPQLKHIPVIAITGYADPDIRTRSYDAGCTKVVVKPYPLKELLHLLNSVITAEA